MKTKTSKWIALTLLMITIILTISSFKSNGTDVQKYLTMIAIESRNEWGSRMVIIDENGKTEEIALEKLKSPEVHISNSIKVHQTVNSIANRGYDLAFVYSEGFLVNYIFRKK